MKNNNRLLLILSLIGTLLIAQMAHSNQKNDIIAMFDQFVISDTAAKQCITPSQELFSQFVTNFDVVSNFAFRELIKKHPNITKEKISKTMALKARSLILTTKHMVRIRGCTDPDIQSIVARYHLHAKWEPVQSF